MNAAGPAAVRLGAAARRHLEALAAVLPYFPDPAARCVAHGTRFCRSCSANPGSCAGTEDVGCGHRAATGMHWDTCPNRVPGAPR